MSINLSDFGGPVLNGAIDGNPLLIKIYKQSESIEYTTAASYSAGSGNFGDLLLAVSELSFGNDPILGCTDSNACNYDQEATEDDGSCEYAEEYYDCDGDCINDEDSDDICDELDECVGEYDECGICNGDGIPEGDCDCDGNIEDCLGECGGDAVLDECGICDGEFCACGDCC